MQIRVAAALLALAIGSAIAADSPVKVNQPTTGDAIPEPAFCAFNIPSQPGCNGTPPIDASQVDVQTFVLADGKTERDIDAACNSFIDRCKSRFTATIPILTFGCHQRAHVVAVTAFCTGYSSGASGGGLTSFTSYVGRDAGLKQVKLSSSTCQELPNHKGFCAQDFSADHPIARAASQKPSDDVGTAPPPPPAGSTGQRITADPAAVGLPLNLFCKGKSGPNCRSDIKVSNNFADVQTYNLLPNADVNKTCAAWYDQCESFVRTGNPVAIYGCGMRAQQPAIIAFCTVYAQADMAGQRRSVTGTVASSLNLKQLKLSDGKCNEVQPYFCATSYTQDHDF